MMLVGGVARLPSTALPTPEDTSVTASSAPEAPVAADVFWTMSSFAKEVSPSVAPIFAFFDGASDTTAGGRESNQ